MGTINTLHEEVFKCFAAAQHSVWMRFRCSSGNIGPSSSQSGTSPSVPRLASIMAVRHCENVSFNRWWLWRHAIYMKIEFKSLLASKHKNIDAGRDTPAAPSINFQSDHHIWCIQIQFCCPYSICKTFHKFHGNYNSLEKAMPKAKKKKVCICI